MPKPSSARPKPAPRADKQRNRARLLAAARATFASKGGRASLDEIARAAGVGIGTLYRHFPARDDLLIAVYQQEIDALVQAATRLKAEREPQEALREWLLLFVEFLDAKQDMAEALGTLINGPEELYSETPNHLADAINLLVDQLNEAHTLDADLEPLDLLRAITGVATARPSPRWKAAATQMVDILIDGMHTKRTPSSGF